MPTVERSDATSYGEDPTPLLLLSTYLSDSRCRRPAGTTCRASLLLALPPNDLSIPRNRECHACAQTAHSLATPRRLRPLGESRSRKLGTRILIDETWDSRQPPCVSLESVEYALCKQHRREVRQQCDVITYLHASSVDESNMFDFQSRAGKRAVIMSAPCSLKLNVTMVEYRNRDLRAAAAKLIDDALNASGFGPGGKKIADGRKSGCSTDEVYSPKVCWFAKMNSYLRPFVQQRPAYVRTQTKLVLPGPASREESSAIESHEPVHEELRESAVPKNNATSTPVTSNKT
ncbi:hypothetical protein PR048_001894 [Dryococelus australis]|uniref:Uncharacterized protein n=1 Tax=Dryococelus australis TaxID=614101 RepID=A0ABQ9IIL8_9NEOP|nr:hypothetical protein PR048_001894 [Dryococelus australis]